jgi:hypothetical protein
MKERFLNTIRRWYIDYHDLNGKFPEIPLEEEGGSKTILKLETTSAPPIHIEIPNPQTKKVIIFSNSIIHELLMNYIKKVIIIIISFCFTLKENPPPVTSKAAGVVPRKRAEEDAACHVRLSSPTSSYYLSLRELSLKEGGGWQRQMSTVHRNKRPCRSNIKLSFSTDNKKVITV